MIMQFDKSRCTRIDAPGGQIDAFSPNLQLTLLITLLCTYGKMLMCCVWQNCVCSTIKFVAS